VKRYQADCQYCSKNEILTGIMIEICRLDVSTLYLMRDQTHPGRCVVALGEHETELFGLDDDTLCRFTRDAARAAAAVQRVFRADKINYAIYGDLVPHLHYHIVPKQRGGESWGGPFELSPAEKKLLSEDGYRERMAAIREQL
jgi:ATP adenylyltransferase